MDEQTAQQVAEGVLAFQIISHFFGNQLAHGVMRSDAVEELLTIAEGRALTSHGTLTLPIAQAADRLRRELRGVVRQH